jgi:transposase
MDNAAIHHGPEVRQIIEEECRESPQILPNFKLNRRLLVAKLIYLPAYSPDFNPIEESFSAVKAWLRRHGEERTGMNEKGWVIAEASEAISPESARGWFRDCGYF